MITVCTSVTVAGIMAVETAVGCVDVLVDVRETVGLVVEDSINRLVCVKVAYEMTVFETVGVVT